MTTTTTTFTGLVFWIFEMLILVIFSEIRIYIFNFNGALIKYFLHPRYV